MRQAHDDRVEQNRIVARGEPGTARLIAFSAPMLVIVGIELAWRVYLPAHLTRNPNLSLTTVGALLFAARLFDIAADPIVAWSSDRFRTRWGHRRPWLVAAVPPIMAGVAGLFFLGPSLDVGTVLGAALLLHLGYTLLVTPHGGWAIELAETPYGRMRVMAARTWVALAGVVALLLVPSVMEGGLGADRAGQVAALGWALMLLTPLGVWLTLRYTAEPPRLLACNDRAPPWRAFLTVLTVAALRPILLLYLLAGVAEAGSAAVFLLFVDGVLALPGWGSSLLLVQAGVTLVSLPIWARAARRLGQRQVLALCYGWQVLVVPCALILPAGSLAAAVTFLVARGVFGGVEFMVLRVMVAEIADEAKDRGVRAGAICYSVSSITLRLGMGLGPMLVLSTLSLLEIQGLSDAAPLSHWQQSALRLIFSAPPFLAGAIGLMVLFVRRRQVERGAARHDRPSDGVRHN